ncbi:hypothetical protein [Anaerosolibacter sp.]|uniref:hypothetical protein n=1 Tax=Anaerosolibacter sp. TaxID=1872527 RepID=UPI0039F1224F
MSDTLKGILAIITVALVAGDTLYSEVKANYKKIPFKFDFSTIREMCLVGVLIYLMVTISDLKVVMHVCIVLVVIQIPVVCLIAYKKWKNTKEIQYLLPFLYPILMIWLLSVGIKN